MLVFTRSKNRPDPLFWLDVIKVTKPGSVLSFVLFSWLNGSCVYC